MCRADFKLWSSSHDVNISNINFIDKKEKVKVSHEEYRVCLCFYKQIRYEHGGTAACSLIMCDLIINAFTAQPHPRHYTELQTSECVQGHIVNQ